MDATVERTIGSGRLFDMERPLTKWEHDLLAAMAAVDGPRAEFVRESLSHLVVTGGCECGCRSFNVRDERHPPQPHELLHYSNAWSPDRTASFALWLGPDGRPISVDDFSDGTGEPPDPRGLVIEAV